MKELLPNVLRLRLTLSTRRVTRISPINRVTYRRPIVSASHIFHRNLSIRRTLRILILHQERVSPNTFLHPTRRLCRIIHKRLSRHRHPYLNSQYKLRRHRQHITFLHHPSTNLKEQITSKLRPILKCRPRDLPIVFRDFRTVSNTNVLFYRGSSYFGYSLVYLWATKIPEERTKKRGDAAPSSLSNPGGERPTIFPQP